MIAVASANGPYGLIEKPQAVVIGASSGAIDAVSKILDGLPLGFPLPIIVVIHLPPHRQSMLAEVFQSRSRMSIVEAEDKEPIQGGTVYLAPPNYHLLVEKNHCLSLSSDEPVNFSRPSIDVLFETAADAYEPALVGIILTGGNSDGAQGLREVHTAGGLTVVQRPDIAHTPAMPIGALQACPTPLVFDLDEIITCLLEIADFR